MRDHLDTRAASINNYYKESLFKPTEVSKIGPASTCISASRKLG